MTTALFLLRALTINLTLKDLATLHFGEVLDMFTETHNDKQPWADIATQEDIEKYFG